MRVQNPSLIFMKNTFKRLFFYTSLNSIFLKEAHKLENKEKIYCIFNNEKESFHSQIEKAFKEYLKDLEMQDKQIYNNIADDC